MKGGVSILVFLEPLLRQRDEGGEDDDCEEFQSLFFWNHCLDASPPNFPTLPGWFQSLFFWNHCLDIKPLCYLLRLSLFQSLFFWNHCLDHSPSHSPHLNTSVSILVFLEPLLRHLRLDAPWRRKSKFQSLFFWNHCLDCWEMGKIKHTAISFNPCFSGTTA